ncbi:MAG: ribonuclease HIII [candidate division WS6 bacterium 34_10]|uniref:Ribonuclease n=1 Tax=candidate division WS6 bacterium 34_10 TaxID=1641389 RepID=A0A101HFW9_9BACT|nr:MAG: ribonuclease HIII [candidate division WS6 bacterium 34_10]
MSQNTVSLKLDEEQIQNFGEMMEALGWTPKKIKNDYVEYAFTSSEGSVATLYSSGKLVIQGKENFTPVISHIKANRGKSPAIQAHIGVDEVGKGDYFGPMVVVACYVNNEFADKLSHLGFDDSKRFSDRKIKELYNQVKDYKYYYPSILHPAEYNDKVNKEGNVSIVLAKEHSKCIENALIDLKKNGVPCESVVIDQFSSKKSRVLDELGDLGKEVKFTQFHRGESDIAVAAASIIARGIFLEEFEKMDKEYDFHFPKGASNVVDSAISFVQKYGKEELRNVAKIGFKTTQRILALV